MKILTAGKRIEGNSLEDIVVQLAQQDFYAKGNKHRYMRLVRRRLKKMGVILPVTHGDCLKFLEALHAVGKIKILE